MRLSARLFALCLPLFSLPALAAPVSGLYQVREAVTSQQPEERSAALNRALETLVLRLRSVGKPLMLGLALVATGVGLLTYVLVTWIWFAKVKWSRRKRRTATGRASAE